MHLFEIRSEPRAQIIFHHSELEIEPYENDNMTVTKSEKFFILSIDASSRDSPRTWGLNRFASLGSRGIAIFHFCDCNNTVITGLYLEIKEVVNNVIPCF